MVILNFINRRIVEPQVRKLREDARTQGMAEGRAQANQQWSAWNRRRLEAKTRGWAFDEPSPDETEALAQSHNGPTPNQGEQTSD